MVAVTSIVFAGVLAIQLPQVQTYVTDKVVDKLSESLDGDIVFEKIHLKPFTTLVLKNVAIIDRNPVMNPNDTAASPVDTLFRAQYIIARFTLEGLVRQEGVHLSKAYISNAQMSLVLENKPDRGDGDITTENLSRIFRIKKPEQPRRSEKEIFHIDKVEISGMDFTMKNHMAKEIAYHGGINWNDLQVKDIQINARDLMFKGGIMTGELDHLGFREQSGWVCESITGSARVGRGKTIISDLHIRDRWSDIRMPEFMMTYKNVREFKYFIDRVRLDADIEDTRLDFRTLWYFAPQLYGNRLRTSLSGKVGGLVSDFLIDGLRLGMEGSRFSGKVSGRISGLPDISQTRLDAGLREFLLTSEGLDRFIGEWMDGKDLGLGEYAKGILFSM